MEPAWHHRARTQRKADRLLLTAHKGKKSPQLQAALDAAAKRLDSHHGSSSGMQWYLDGDYGKGDGTQYIPGWNGKGSSWGKPAKGMGKTGKGTRKGKGKGTKGVYGIDGGDDAWEGLPVV